jgi:hypothetical protein
MKSYDDVTTRSLITGWLAAAFSGQYDKAKEELRSEDGGFCIQGVLGEVLAASGRAEWIERDHAGASEFLGDYRLRAPSVVDLDYNPTSCASIPGVPGSMTYNEVMISTESMAEAARKAVGQRLPDGFEAGMKEQLGINNRMNVLIAYINDNTNLSVEEMGEILYEVYTGVMGINLPPKKEIKKLSVQTGCEQGETEEAEVPEVAAEEQAAISVPIN